MITSPGSTASGLLINKELNKNIPSIRRNPILADIFARIKFMDIRGSSFDKIINGTNRLFNDNENHVEFYATTTHFSIVIYNANYDAQKDAQKDVQKDAQNNTENGIESLLMQLINNNPYMTRIKKAEKIGKSKATVERIIKKSQKIIYKGSSKNGYCEITK